MRKAHQIPESLSTAADLKTDEELFYLSKNGDTTGPFTCRQVRSLWHSGGITADTLYWTEKSGDWQPLLSIAKQLDESGTGSSGSPVAVAVETMLRANRCKSTAAAALLALFLPFVGCFYSSPPLGIAFSALAAFCAYCYSVLQGELWLVAIGGLYVVSIGSALFQVRRFNDAQIRLPSDEEAEQLPLLWNLKDNYLWSALLTPVVSSFLVAANWQRLGRKGAAAFCYIAGIAVACWVGYGILNWPVERQTLCRYIGLLFVWNFVISMPQESFVEEEVKLYRERSWTVPVLASMAFLALLVWLRLP